MKFFNRAILFSVFTLCFAIDIYAQRTTELKTDIAKNYEKRQREERISKILGTLMTFGIEEKLLMMKSQGVTEKEFYSLLTASGQLFDNVDNYGDLASGNFDADGIAVIPYKIKISPEGLSFVEVSVAKLHIFESIDSDVASLDVDFLMLQYNNRFDYLANRELTLSLVKGMYEASANGFGAGAGLRLDVPIYARLDQNSIHPELNFNEGTGYRIDLKAKAGLKTQNDFSITFGASTYFRHHKYRNWVSPQGMVKQETDLQDFNNEVLASKTAMEQWDADKFAWEVANGYSIPVSETFYLASTSAGPRPQYSNSLQYPYIETYAQNVVRNTIVLTPTLSLKKDFYSKSGKIKQSVEVSLEADLFLLDKFTGKREQVNRPFQKQEKNTGANLTDEELVNFKKIGSGSSQNNFTLRLVYKFGARN
jgi:hypothetical protein